MIKHKMITHKDPKSNKINRSDTTEVKLTDELEIKHTGNVYTTKSKDNRPNKQINIATSSENRDQIIGEPSANLITRTD